MRRWFLSLGVRIMQKFLAGIVPIAFKTVPHYLGAALAALLGPYARTAMALTTLSDADRSLLRIELASRLHDPNHVCKDPIGDLRPSEVDGLVQSLAEGALVLASAKLAEWGITLTPEQLRPTLAVLASRVELA